MKRSNIFSALLLSILAVGLFFLPIDSVLAQGGAGGFVPCDGPDCNFCHFIQLGNNVLNWLFTIVFLIFGVILVAAGFELVTSGGNRSRLDDAKKKLSNALIGILIMFSAWLLIDTLLKGVLDQSFGPWNEISCGGGQVDFQEVQPYTVNSSGQLCPPGESTAGGNCFDPADLVSSENGELCFADDDFSLAATGCLASEPCGTLTCYQGTLPGGAAGAPVTGEGEADSRALLDTVGITVNNDGRACPSNMTYQQYRASNGVGCTSVAGLNPALINAIGVMNNECGAACNGGQLVVTGGTEAGHSGCNPAGIPSCSNPGSHSAGDKVDFGVGTGSNGPALTSYFNDNTYFTNGLQGSRPARVHRQTGVACVFEGTHWDCQRPL